MAQGDPKGAEAYFRMAVNMEPSSKFYSNLGVSLIRLNRLDEAKEALEKAREVGRETGIMEVHTLEENFRALNQHLEYREKQRRKQMEEREIMDMAAAKADKARKSGKMVFEEEEEDEEED